MRSYHSSVIGKIIFNLTCKRVSHVSLKNKHVTMLKYSRSSFVVPQKRRTLPHELLIGLKLYFRINLPVLHILKFYWNPHLHSTIIYSNSKLWINVTCELSNFAPTLINLNWKKNGNDCDLNGRNAPQIIGKLQLKHRIKNIWLVTWDHQHPNCVSWWRRLSCLLSIRNQGSNIFIFFAY